MAWKLLRINNGHLSLENDEFDSEQIFEVLAEIERKFGNNSKFGEKLGITPSSASVELSVDGVQLTLGWDIWSGVFIMAWDDSGDQIIQNTLLAIFL